MNIIYESSAAFKANILKRNSVLNWSSFLDQFYQLSGNSNFVIDFVTIFVYSRLHEKYFEGLTISGYETKSSTDTDLDINKTEEENLNSVTVINNPYRGT